MLRTWESLKSDFGVGGTDRQEEEEGRADRTERGA